MLVSGWTNNNNSVFLSYWCFLHYHPICSCQHRGKTENGVIKEHGLSITGATFVLNKVVHCYFSYRHCTHLLMHDDGQLSGEVPVVGLHLIVIFLLVLFDQPLVDAQAVAARLHKMPAQKQDCVLRCDEAWSTFAHTLWAVGISSHLKTSFSCLTLLSGYFLALASSRKARAYASGPALT